MHAHLILLFLFLLFMGCTQPSHSPRTALPIELDFRQLSADKADVFFQNAGIADSVRSWLNEDFLWMSVKNNAYDSLLLHLVKFGEMPVFTSDVCNVYRVEGDSLIPDGGDIRCFGRADSVLCLGKGESTIVYFQGRCSDQQAAYEYNFNFYADSLGQKKFPQFKQFPCGNILPKK